MRFVIDTNILVSTVVRDEHSSKSLQLLKLTGANGIDLDSPQVALHECAHVLLKLYRLKRLTFDQARRSYDAATRISFVRSYDAMLSLSDFEMGLTRDIVGNDLFFVLLAQQLRCPLVTMDGALRTNASPLVEVLDLDEAIARLPT